MLLYSAQVNLSSITRKCSEDKQMNVVHSSNMNLQEKGRNIGNVNKCVPLDLMRIFYQGHVKLSGHEIHVTLDSLGCHN